MSGDVHLELWLHEYKMHALSAVLEEQSSSVEKRMQSALNELYAELVPPEIQRGIRQRIDAESAAEQAEIEAARKYTAFRVEENGAENFFQLDRRESFLDVAKSLRWCLRQEPDSLAAAFQKSFYGLKPISSEQYGQIAAYRMEHPEKVTGVFDLDFDQKTASSVDPVGGWKTYSMKDVSAAVYHACRKSYLSAGQYEARFAAHLADKQIATADHLHAVENGFSAFVGGRLGDILPKLIDSDALCFVHEAELPAYLDDAPERDFCESEGHVTVLPASELLKLTSVGEQEYAALLDAQVQEIRDTPYGTTAVIAGVEPQEMARFADDYANFMEAEEQMGPVM